MWRFPIDFHFSAAGNGSKSVMIGPFIEIRISASCVDVFNLFRSGVLILLMVEKTLSTEAEAAGRTARQARSLEMLGNATVIESRTLASPEQPAACGGLKIVHTNLVGLELIPEFWWIDAKG